MVPLGMPFACLAGVFYFPSLGFPPGGLGRGAVWFGVPPPLANGSRGPTPKLFSGVSWLPWSGGTPPSFSGNPEEVRSFFGTMARF